MLFNSYQFFVFFIIVYPIYLLLNHKWQNRWLLLASYVFYGSWDYRFLSLIFISTLLDYYCGIKIYTSGSIRLKKRFLVLSICGNLVILGFFKYFNFFASSFESFAGLFGLTVHPFVLSIVLPVGISFYTFQSMSYTIDVFRGAISPTRKFFDFALYVAFFPQLVAGPIERASRLLPQVLNRRTITLEKFYEGCYLIFWGFFQKIFIADNLAQIADLAFVQRTTYHGIDVLIGLYAFSFQIFCDFAGYSNIARGLAKCMGFELMVNFNLPYFATNPQDFWRRWHISLSTWLRDYLYIPLGGNQKGRLKTYRNLMLTMLLGGLWHGAAWTFVLWGAYHGLLLCIHRFLKPIRTRWVVAGNKFVENVWYGIRVFVFFHLVCLGWLLFRAASLSQFCQMLHALFFNFPLNQVGDLTSVINRLIFLLVPLLAMYFLQWAKKDLTALLRLPFAVKGAVYVLGYYLLILYGASGGKEFIYFQF